MQRSLCGKNCLRCWQNKLKYGCRHSKPELGFGVQIVTPDIEPKLCAWERRNLNYERKQLLTKERREKQLEKKQRRLLNKTIRDNNAFVRWLNRNCSNKQQLLVV